MLGLFATASVDAGPLYCSHTTAASAAAYYIAQRRVGPHGVVMLSPVFDGDLSLLECVEDFAVEQFVTELRIEALAITVFHGVLGMM
jgi:hypothetical protein